MAFSLAFDSSALLPGFKEHAARGIGRYVAELKGFFDSHPDPEISVSYFDHAEVIGGSVLSSLIDRLPAGRQTVKQQLFYPFSLNRGVPGRSDLIHFPAHMDAPSWSSRPFAVTVLDLIPLVLENLYRPAMPGWRFRLARFLENRAIRSARHVIAISESTARDVQRILGVPAERISVTPLGVDKRFFKTEFSPSEIADFRLSYKIAADAPVVLYVGGIDQRKNTAGLLSVFAEVLIHFKQRSGPLPVLFVAGRIEQDRQYPSFKARVAALGLEDFVKTPGYLSDKELLKVYAASSVFFFPSLYEGFGLPPLEAMAGGLPVVSSNTSAMPEVIGDAGAMFNPDSPQEAVREIIEIIQNRDYSLALAEKGRRRAGLFSWERTGEKTYEAYRRALKSGA